MELIYYLKMMFQLSIQWSVIKYLHVDQVRSVKYMNCDTTKPVFCVFDKARPKPVSSATETS